MKVYSSCASHALATCTLVVYFAHAEVDLKYQTGLLVATCMYARLFLATWGGAGSSLVHTPEACWLQTGSKPGISVCHMNIM